MAKKTSRKNVKSKVVGKITVAKSKGRGGASRIPRNVLTAGGTDFVRCVLGPSAGSARQVPDGSSTSSIAVLHKSCYTLRPLASGDLKGSLMFAITPNCSSGLALIRGTMEVAPVFNMNGSTWTYPAITWPAQYIGNTLGPISGNSTNFNGFDTPAALSMPFPEYQKGNPVDRSQNANFIGVQDWRTVSSRGEIHFSGPVLNNSGYCVVGRQVVGVKNISQPSAANIASFNRSNYDMLTGYHVDSVDGGYEQRDFTIVSTNSVTPANMTGGNVLPSLRMAITSEGPSDQSSVCSLQGATTFPARNSFCVENIMQDYEYQPYVTDAICTVENAAQQHLPSWGQPLIPGGIMDHNRSGNSTGVDLSNGSIIPTTLPGFGHGTTTFIYMAGLDPDTASVTVHVENCIEYTVGFNSSVARFATQPPPKDQRAIDIVSEVQKHLPTARPIGDQSFLTNALQWYGNTMRDIIGTSWKIGGQVMGAFGLSGGDIARAAGGAIMQRRAPAIAY